MEPWLGVRNHLLAVVVGHDVRRHRGRSAAHCLRGRGYNASGLNCTIRGATGNVGPFTGKGGSRYTAVQVTGVIAAPAAPAGVTVVKTYTGTTVISGANPVRDNTYGGGRWKQTYHWNAWNVEPDQAGNTYGLLLPPIRRSARPSPAGYRSCTPLAATRPRSLAAAGHRICARQL